MINVLLVEDDLVQADALFIILTKAFPNMRFHKAHDYNTALNAIHSVTFQLFLLDINLEDSNSNNDGVKLGETIRSISQYQTTPILYLTANSGEIFRALHNTNCYNFLVKPYEPSELLTSITKLLNSPLIKEPPLEFRDIYGTYARIPYENILYIKAMKHNSAIYTINNFYETSNFNIKKLLEILPDYFLQCHRSYIVNSNYIEAYDNQISCINLSKGSHILVPVGRNFKYKIKEQMK